MMLRDFTNLSICVECAQATAAAQLFQQELQRRTDRVFPITNRPDGVCIRFAKGEMQGNKDAFTISRTSDGLCISGAGIRAWIYGYSLFLRKTDYTDGRITLVEPIEGRYVPDKAIRGHQLGYRRSSNTYDAWSVSDYRRYFLDLMAFGCNTVEMIPCFENFEPDDIMQYDPNELCVLTSEIADELDLDVSLWCPNDTLPLEESVQMREQLFAKLPRLDCVFVPGGDPGEYPPDVFMERVCAISDALRRTHPEAKMWPSAQAPHSIPDWGDGFIRETEKLPKQIDGVITGPNRAFPLDVLRRKLPDAYPIRLYPDITHNIRCEYPVHALREDWHFAFAATLSRESINPRAQEYRLIHRLTRSYVVGSVTYSDGVNDDVNKMVWADMDFDPSRPLRETLLDYARAFIPQAPAAEIADGILALEANWNGDPAEDPHIDDSLCRFESLSQEHPQLLRNWRFVQLLFRARCDAYVRRRRVFDLELLRRARRLLEDGQIRPAQQILRSDYPEDIRKLRAMLFENAKMLRELIGMQLDVAHFGANQWERGATLETIDLPVTDRAFYLDRLQYAETLDPDKQAAFICGLLHREDVPRDGFYYSVAKHGLDALGVRQTPDFYMDFQGDRPSVNNGSLPTAQFCLFDHFSFRCKIGGMQKDKFYKLRVCYTASKNNAVTEHRVSVNGKVIYCGAQYGGEKDPSFDRDYLAPGSESATYLLPPDLFENGCAELLIEEPTVGVKLYEFWIFAAES